jgi:hypothetical protein
MLGTRGQCDAVPASHRLGKAMAAALRGTGGGRAMAAAVCRTRVSVSWAVVGSSRDGESGRCDGVDAIALPSQTPRFHALSAALRPRAIHQSRRPPSRLRLPWLRAAQCTRLTRLASPWGTSGLVRPHRRPCDASAVHRLGRHCSTYIHLHTPGRRRLEHFGGRY